MTSFNNFSANETLNFSQMNYITGGKGSTFGINNDMLGYMKKKYADAPTQSFVFVNKGIQYKVFVNEKSNHMTFTNAKGLTYVMKF